MRRLAVDDLLAAILEQRQVPARTREPAEADNVGRQMATRRR
jgi:hypothetical protein